MNVKGLGQVFTPYYIVNFMLDEIGYKGKEILTKKILEPSAGDGAFLLQIISRILSESKKLKKTKSEIIKIIKSNVFAIEIDDKKYEELLKNLISHLKDYNVTESMLKENIIRGDSLKHNWGFKFDYVVGNPPYVRLHNLEKDYINWLRGKFFSMEKGSVDLYYAFIENGFSSLAKNGKLIFITPNNFLCNNSGNNLRLLIKNNIKNIFDFQSMQIFQGASTYNSIFTLSRQKNKGIKGYLATIVKSKVCKNKARDVLNINGKIIIKKSEDFSNVFEESKKIELDFKNGLATLADGVFISNNVYDKGSKIKVFNGYEIESKLIKNVKKISTNKDMFCLFPYKEDNGRNILIPENDLKTKFPLGYKYLSDHKKILKNRSLEKKSAWYSFGRSQAINSNLFDKVILGNLLRDKVIYNFVPAGTLVYSGLYSEYKKPKKAVESYLSSNELYNFLITMGSDKRGGYKQFNSTILREARNG